MAKKIQLEKCPWCPPTDNSNLDLWLLLGSNRHYCISCSNCGCKGPIVEEENRKIAFRLASELWNARTP